MKKILSAIGRFFVGIWNWIKNTAWVQPLLIVGAIFALIMSIRPIADWITQITNVETTSTFYSDHKVDYKTLIEKIEGTKDAENKVLIAIYIKEKNDTCEQCVNAQKPLEGFFSDDHKDVEKDRSYEIVVLDIAEDEFTEGKVDDADLKDISDHIEEYNLDEVWEYDMSDEFKGDATVNVAADDPLSTPAIMRYEDGNCVGIKMGYASDEYDQFKRFCYYDPNTDFTKQS